jgi:hypothetical protein
MSAQRLRQEIATFVESMWNARLVRDSNVPIIQPLGGRTASVSWSGTVGGGIASRNGPSLEEYADLIRARQYTLLLLDYSLLQISFIFEGSKVAKHRLVYYPCPLILEPEESDMGILDVIEILSDRELVLRLRQETPFRFEFDPNAASEDHAASHLHVSRDSCRIPVYAPLSLGRFIRFVFRNFYAAEWQAHSFLREWTCESMINTISASQRTDLHLACES